MLTGGTFLRSLKYFQSRSVAVLFCNPLLRFGSWGLSVHLTALDFHI